MKNISAGFGLPDLTAFLLLLWYGMPEERLVPLLALYFVLKLPLSGRSAVAGALAFLTICGWTIYEAASGLLQAAGVKMSNHAAFAITGSFENPGPYGGFIAVGMSVALAYAVRFRRRCRGAYRVTMMAAALLTLASGFLVLPASMSRAGWLALAAAAVLALASDRRIRLRLESAAHKGLFAAAALILLGGSAAGAFMIKRDSALGRLHIWRIECLAIAQRPLSGSGPGSAMGAYGETQEKFFRSHQDAPAAIVRVAGCPEYAFNEYLGIGMERGVPGLLLAALNGIPAKMGGLCNDACNIVLLRRRPADLRYMWIQLTAAALIQTGTSPRSLPDEWFPSSDTAIDYSDLMQVSMPLMQASRLQDSGRWDEACTLLDGVYAHRDQLLGLLRLETEAELLFTLLMLGRTDRARSLWTEQLKTYVTAHSRTSSAKQRILFAVARCLDADEARANSILADVCRRRDDYLMQGEATMDIRLMEELAEKCRISAE